MPVFLWVLIAIIGYLYISYYYRYPDGVGILQTPLASFDLAMLLEKRPVLLEDQLPSIMGLFQLWKMPSKEIKICHEEWYRSTHKQLFLYPLADTEVLLYPPSKPMVNREPSTEESLLAIQLKPHQVLILPLHWRLYLAQPFQGRAFGYHDWLTWALKS